MSVKRYTAAGSGVMRTDPKGGYVNYSDYLELANQPDPLTAYLYAAELAKDEVKRLKAEVERLEQQVKYWRIEAETDHARWLRVLEELETLRKKP